MGLALLLLWGGASVASASGAITLSGTQQAPVLGGAMVLHAGEDWSSAPFTIQDPNGGPAFTITRSEINQATKVGAFPNLFVGCNGFCTKNDPFPLQLSSIKPGEVTSSVTSVAPSSATGTWAHFYDIFITGGPHQRSEVAPREELEIWQNSHNRGFGQPVANVNFDGTLYGVYPLKSSIPGTTFAYVPQTPTDFHGDLLPFIQDSINRGYARPNWYLIEVANGYEISDGNVIGLGDANFGVTVGSWTAPTTTTAPPPPALTPTPPLMTASFAKSLAERMVAAKTHRHPRLVLASKTHRHRHPRLKGSCRSVNNTTATCHLAWTVRGTSYTATGKIWDWISSGTAYWSYNFHGRRTSKRCMLLHPASSTCRRSFHWR